MHLLSHMSHMAQSSWLCVCVRYTQHLRSHVFHAQRHARSLPQCSVCWILCILQSQGGKGESAVTEMLIQKHKEEGAHDKLEVRLPSLNMPRSMSISFLFFSPYFSALHPTLCHICRCGCQPRSQANFTSECKRILAPIPEIKFKMLLGLLGSVETCPVIRVGLVRYMIYVVLLEFSQLSISECVRCLIWRISSESIWVCCKMKAPRPFVLFENKVHEVRSS